MDAIEATLRIEANGLLFGFWMYPRRRVDCRTCGVSVEQRNLFEHRWSKRHRRLRRRELTS